MQPTKLELLKKYGKKYRDAQIAFRNAMNQHRISTIRCKECHCSFASPDRICPICKNHNPIQKREKFYPEQDINKTLYDKAKSIYGAAGVKSAIKDYPWMNINILLEDMIQNANKKRI